MQNFRFTDWRTSKAANSPREQLTDWHTFQQGWLIVCTFVSSGTEQPNLSQLWSVFLSFSLLVGELDTNHSSRFCLLSNTTFALSQASRPAGLEDASSDIFWMPVHTSVEGWMAKCTAHLLGSDRLYSCASLAKILSVFGALHWPSCCLQLKGLTTIGCALSKKDFFLSFFIGVYWHYTRITSLIFNKSTLTRG